MDLSGNQVGCLLALATFGLLGLSYLAPPLVTISLAVLTLCAYLPIAWYAHRR